jgi:hypothetical protein
MLRREYECFACLRGCKNANARFFGDCLFSDKDIFNENQMLVSILQQNEPPTKRACSEIKLLVSYNGEMHEFKRGIEFP